MISMKPKSLRSILSSFTKVVEELEVLKQYNNGKVGALTTRVVELQDQIVELNDETAQAVKVQEKINNLVS